MKIVSLRPVLWTLFAALLVGGEASAQEEEAAETAESTPKPEATATEESEGEEEDFDEDTANALGAANPVVASNSGKPWQLAARLGLNMGSSTFARNSRAQGGYSFRATGLYRLMPLFEGRLDALASISFDQTVVDGFLASAPGANEEQSFFFRDIRLGILGRGLYKWKATGLTFGANMTFDLPTSDLAQFAGRVVRWNTGVNVADMFQNVGPGSLLFTAGFTFRKDIGEINPSIDPVTQEGEVLAVCRANSGSGGQCFTQAATLNYAFLYGGSLRYFLDSFSFGIGVTAFNAFFHNLRDSEPGDLLASQGGSSTANTVGQGQFASDAPNHSMFLSSSVDVTYIINKYFNVSLGLNSLQVPFRFQDGNPRALVSPFFDSPELNNTSVFASFSAMY